MMPNIIHRVPLFLDGQKGDPQLHPGKLLRGNEQRSIKRNEEDQLQTRTMMPESAERSIISMRWQQPPLEQWPETNDHIRSIRRG